MNMKKYRKDINGLVTELLFTIIYIGILFMITLI